MNCVRCGYLNKDTDNFCANCSEPLQGVSSATVAQTKKPLYKKWWFWAIVLLVVSAAFNNISSAQRDLGSSEITKNNVVWAISNETISERITDVTNENGIVTVVLYFETIWDAESFVQLNQSLSSETFETLFKNPTVQWVVYQADLTVTDAYGNSSRITGQTISMSRDDANKVSDWEYFSLEEPYLFYSVVDSELFNAELREAWSEICSRGY